jgi:hypothetical protein
VQVTTAAEALLAFVKLARLPAFSEVTVKVSDGTVSLIRYGRTLRLEELAGFVEDEHLK